jgi:hypothetical protein
VSPITVENRKALTTAVSLALILSAVTGTQLVDSGNADPYFEYGSTGAPLISLDSPTSKTYAGPVRLSFTVAQSEHWLPSLQEFNSASYYVDGVLRGSVKVNSDLSSPYNYSVLLSNLTDGRHTVSVTFTSTGWILNTLSGEVYRPTNTTIATVSFALDTTPPKITVLTPLNSTYTQPEVPLTFTVNEPASWNGYSLDGQDILFAANITLTELPVGSHTLKLYANDTAGNVGASETVTFSIAKPETAAPFPTEAAVAVSGASLAAVGLALLLYRRKHKREAKPS